MDLQRCATVSCSSASSPIQQDERMSSLRRARLQEGHQMAGKLTHRVTVCNASPSRHGPKQQHKEISNTPASSEAIVVSPSPKPTTSVSVRPILWTSATRSCSRAASRCSLRAGPGKQGLPSRIYSPVSEGEKRFARNARDLTASRGPMPHFETKGQYASYYFLSGRDLSERLTGASSTRKRSSPSKLSASQQLENSKRKKLDVPSNQSIGITTFRSNSDRGRASENDRGVNRQANNRKSFSLHQPETTCHARPTPWRGDVVTSTESSDRIQVDVKTDPPVSSLRCADDWLINSIAARAKTSQPCVFNQDRCNPNDSDAHAREHFISSSFTATRLQRPDPPAKMIPMRQAVKFPLKHTPRSTARKTKTTTLPQNCAAGGNVIEQLTSIIPLHEHAEWHNDSTPRTPLSPAAMSIGVESTTAHVVSTVPMSLACERKMPCSTNPPPETLVVHGASAIPASVEKDNSAVSDITPGTAFIAGTPENKSSLVNTETQTFDQSLSSPDVENEPREVDILRGECYVNLTNCTKKVCSSLDTNMGIPTSDVSAEGFSSGESENLRTDKVSGETTNTATSSSATTGRGGTCRGSVVATDKKSSLADFAVQKRGSEPWSLRKCPTRTNNALLDESSCDGTKRVYSPVVKSVDPSTAAENCTIRHTRANPADPSSACQSSGDSTKRANSLVVKSVDPPDEEGNPFVNSPSDMFSVNALHKSVQSGDLNAIKKDIQSLHHPFRMMGLADGEIKHIVRALITASVEIEENWRGAVIHLWARDRYRQRGASWEGPHERNWFEKGAPTADALDSLQLLLEHGADVFCSDGDSQTPLHLAMAYGSDCVVNALLEKVYFGVDRLNAFNAIGETPLQLALSNGHYSCLRLLMNKYDTETITRFKDSEGNNVLGMVVRHTDIQYDRDDAGIDGSQSFALFQEVLDIIRRDELIEALLNENIHGENALHIAAKGGCFYEVAAISKLEFGSGRSVANRCVGSQMVIKGSHELVSPLDLALETKRMAETRKQLKGLSRRAFFARKDEPWNSENWLKNGINPSVNLLREIQKHLPVGLEQVLPSRPAGSKISKTQILSQEAQKFKEENLGSEQRTGEPKIHLYEMKNIKRSNGEGFRSQILQCLANGTTRQVSGALIRDPKHSCVRHFPEPTAPQYCLVAVENIAAGTVLCEYAGLVRRETDEDGIPEQNSYGFKLQKLDEWVLKTAETCYEKSFILDARSVFNESSLINDIRTDVLARERPDREENVGCKEVLLNKWPHVFLVSTRDIKAGEELITDYGPSYWEKHVVSVLKRREERNRACIEQLGQSLAQRQKQAN
ncbi:hypothetical protein ACA910_017166 [Epithemia clementina (nom. ined.)]